MWRAEILRTLSVGRVSFTLPHIGASSLKVQLGFIRQSHRSRTLQRLGGSKKRPKMGQTITKVFPHRKPTDFRRKSTQCMSFSERSIQAMVISQSIIGRPCPSSLILPMLLFIHGSFIFILAIPPQEPVQCLGFLNQRNKLYEHVQTVHTHSHLWQKTFKWKSVTCPIVYELCTYERRLLLIIFWKAACVSVTPYLVQLTFSLEACSWKNGDLVFHCLSFFSIVWWVRRRSGGWRSTTNIQYSRHVWG